ncbi:glycoside hydrolase family 88 protein [Xylanimonas protaetiae]|uniref:Glucuronyl hydrolase n=1 Tax=Xylanimonas protaetiae TaxID=2509457 RepID=A0A4P6FI76_9MICO|nr:glycoside hydrolase family 88 protein [Xylanimonas protaetiae]QAY70268.1 glucuronyl hydrolase [Xylanimonas protaetiae]
MTSVDELTTLVGSALDDACASVLGTAPAFADRYPDDTTRDNLYPVRPADATHAAGANRGWTTSFPAGIAWLGWELTGDAALREAGLRHLRDFDRRVREGDDLETHDLGFLYTLACVAPSRLLAPAADAGDAEAAAAVATGRDAALAAADHLMGRLLEPAGIVQAWGDLTDPAQRGRTIIDSLMNMPLLTWAGRQTGDPRYDDAVRRHTAQLREHILRADDSTFHTFYWDAATGEPLRGATEQGAFDDSCWSRGQAWGIYGFTLNHEATGDPLLLDAARRCADYFLDHLPADAVPFWDLAYGDGSGQPRDSSAAAIAVCGLHELARVEADPDRAERYAAQAVRILRGLVAGYTPTAEGVASDALLLHSVYDAPKGNGVDEGSLWGDYFYLEALVRHARPEWVRYW